MKKDHLSDQEINMGRQGKRETWKKLGQEWIEKNHHQEKKTRGKYDGRYDI